MRGQRRTACLRAVGDSRIGSADSLSLVAFEAPQQELGFSSAQIAGAAIPGQRQVNISTCAAQLSTFEKFRVKRLTQSDRRLTVAGLNRAAVKKPRCGKIALAEEIITASQERRDVRTGCSRVPTLCW